MDPLLPPSSDAGRRPPAPGRLELLRTFMNSVDLESGEDDFAAPGALAEWLTTRGLLARGTRLREEDRVAAVAFREAVREVLEANAGHGSARDAAARLDRIAARIPLRVRVGGPAPLEPAGAKGIDAAIGRLLAIIHESITQGTWQRLKVCRNDTCRWAFYDSSRNRSGAWCTMAICGNRMKGRTFRRRHPAGPATG
jgi:predicted RNA-binding Zn ribbon-like protein